MKIKHGFLLVAGTLFLTACASKTAPVSESDSVVEEPVPSEIATLEIEMHTFAGESVEQENAGSDIGNTTGSPDGFDDTVVSSDENGAEEVYDDSFEQLSDEVEQNSDTEVPGDDELSDLIDVVEDSEDTLLTDESQEFETEVMLSVEETEELETADNSDGFDDISIVDEPQIPEGEEDYPESLEESVVPAIEVQDNLVTEDVQKVSEVEVSDTVLNSEEWEQDTFYELEDEPELIFSDEEEYQIPEPDNTLSATVGEPLVISFETSGWVYLGDLLDSDVVQFDKRQNGLYSTTFTFTVHNSGTALLEFWSVDPLTEEDVYIRYQILAADAEPVHFVEEKTITLETDGGVPDPVQEVPVAETTVQSMYTASATPVEETVAPYSFDPLDEIPFDQWSKEEIIAFFEDPAVVAYYGEESVLYYEAQILETHATAKDIRRSVYCYEELVKKYPTSKWWNYSRERAKYLKKYYFL